MHKIDRSLMAKKNKQKKKTIFKQYKCIKNFDFELPRHFNIAILAPKIAIKHQ